MRTYLVDTTALRQNLQKIQKKAGDATVFAVVKGDGYGLGTENLANLCREEQISHFCVTELSEAQILRDSARDAEEILMIRPTDLREELEALLDLDVILTIGSLEDAVALSGIAREKGKKARAHLKIDTGMGRYGFLPSQTENLLACYEYLDCLDICGVYTHFHSAFVSKKATRKQLDLFLSMVQSIRDAGHDPKMVHCANSSALFRCPETVLDAVRVGSAILGRLAFRTSLKKVGICQTQVTQTKWLPKGHSTGYGSAWRARKPTQIAIVPVGWFHGFTTRYGDDVCRFRDSLRKILSGVKSIFFPSVITVTIAGSRCRTLGHVGMLHTVVDITGKDISVGDEATLDINPLRVRGMEIHFL